MTYVLKDLLLDSKDGEWGRGEPSSDTVPMLTIRGTDFNDVRVGLFDAVPLRHIASRIAARKSLRPLDIVFETAGGSKDRPTGRSVFLKESHFERTDYLVTCASFARFLRIDPEKANPEYIFWMLQHLYNAEVLRKYHTQHTGVARYQYTTFAENELLFLPERETQRRIASILSAYDDIIENNTRRIAILEETARRIYEEWFVCFRFPGHENVRMIDSELGLVPEGWRISEVKDVILRLPAGRVYKVSDVKKVGLVPVIDQSTAELLGFHDNEPGHIASPETPVAIFGDHTCKMQLIVTPFSVGPNTVPFVANELPIHYIYAVISGLVATHEYKRHWSDLMKKEVLVADESCALSYSKLVAPMAALAEVLRCKNRNLRATRDLLLPKLISGEIDVSEIPTPESIAA